MIRTQIQLTEEQIKKAKALARKRGISMAEVIRQSLDAAVESDSISDNIRERALNVIGCIRSGQGDLSEAHDDYITEAFQK